MPSLGRQVTKTGDTTEAQEWTLTFGGALAETNLSQTTVDSTNVTGMGTMTGYTTGDNNQLTNDGTYSYVYDDEGNRTSRTNDTTDYVTEYDWDFHNRLVKVTEKDDMDTTLKVVEYTYDVFDRRIGKEVDTTSPFTMTDAVIERYIIDDASGIASIDGGNVVLDFVDADGDGAGTMDLERRHLYGNAVDQILAQENIDETTSSADRVHWHLTDNLGTVRDLAKNDGTAGEHYEYDAYGAIIDGDTSLTRYLFASREFDEDIDLQYNRARWYDPAVGRWISEDPIGFAAGDANVARYVGNRVTGAVDPSGLIGPGHPSEDGISHLRNRIRPIHRRIVNVVPRPSSPDSVLDLTAKLFPDALRPTTLEEFVDQVKKRAEEGELEELIIRTHGGSSGPLLGDKVEGGDVHHTFAVTYTTLLPQGATYREKRRSIFSRTRSHHATQLDFAQGLMWVRRSGASSLGTVAFSYSAYNSAVFMCFSAQTLHGGQANTRTGPRTKVDYCWLPSPSAGNSSCDALSTRYTRTSSPKIANTAL